MGTAPGQRCSGAVFVSARGRMPNARLRSLSEAGASSPAQSVAAWRSRGARIAWRLDPFPRPDLPTSRADLPMRRLSARSPLSENPREFVLAAILMTVGAVLFAGFGVSTLSGSVYDAGSLKSWELAYQVVGWGKYLAFARLLYLGDRASVRHGYHGWKRTALLWMPLALFILYSYLQWMVMDDARIHYMQRTGQWRGSFSGSVLFMAVIYPIAFAATALNALWIQRRQLRIAL